MKKIYKTPAVNVTSVGIKTIIMQGSEIQATSTEATTQGTGNNEEYETLTKGRNMTDDSWNALW